MSDSDFSTCLSPKEADIVIDKYTHWFHIFIAYVMEESDLMSYNTAKRIVNSTFMTPWRKTFAQFTPDSQVRLFQTMINIVSTLYIYVFASWTLYFFTTVSGVKKLQTIFFKQQGYIIPFFLSFYFRLLEEREMVVVRKIENALGISGSYEAILEGIKFKNVQLVYSAVQPGITSIARRFGFDDPPAESVTDLSEILVRMSLDTIASQTENFLFPNVTKPSITAVYMDLDDIEVGCYIKERDQIDFDDSDIIEFYDKIRRQGYLKEIRKQIKREGKSKKKKVIKLEMERRLEIRGVDGQPICLTGCKKRAKAKSTWCEGPCGKTVEYFGKPWCHVEPNVSRGGVDWEYCDPVRESEKELCFSGYRYRQCTKK